LESFLERDFLNIFPLRLLEALLNHCRIRLYHSRIFFIDLRLLGLALQLEPDRPNLLVSEQLVVLSLVCCDVMLLQAALIQIGLRAPIEDAVEVNTLLLKRVDLNVLLQVRARGESLAAQLALERLLPRVDALVADEV